MKTTFCTVAVVQLNTGSNEGDSTLLFHAKLKPVLLMCERGASQMLVSGVFYVFKCGTVSFLYYVHCFRPLRQNVWSLPLPLSSPFFSYTKKFLKLRSRYPLQQSRILVEKIVQYDLCILLCC